MNKIIVGNVHDYHDCNGKKFIDITDSEEGGMISPRFRMTSRQMLPYQKLLLSTVLPGDEVIVYHNAIYDNALIAGEYIENAYPHGFRYAVCRCGSDLVSDGFEVYCPNAECSITVTSRIARLADTMFFPYNVMVSDHEMSQDFSFMSHDNSSIPFKPILDPKFWGCEFDSLDTVLLGSKFGSVSLATFLVEPLFTGFLDYTASSLSYNNYTFQAIGYFFGYMEELINRRDYHSEAQNTLIERFIWALGIESLKPDVIRKMVCYEVGMGMGGQVLLPYIHFLTSPDELSRELKVHPIEARMIAHEVHKRKYEFHDIFSHYSSEDTADRFLGRMMR